MEELYYKEYVTVQGDRLDMISVRAYGTISRMNEIISLNNQLPIKPEYEAGIRILLPVIENPASNDTSNLPIWKQQV